MATSEKDLTIQAVDKQALSKGLRVDLEHGSIREIDHDAEKKLLRKIDLNLITLFGALYLMSFLGKFHLQAISMK